MFQYLIGGIQTVVDNTYIVYGQLFQYLIGGIQTIERRKPIDEKIGFNTS